MLLVHSLVLFLVCSALLCTKQVLLFGADAASHPFNMVFPFPVYEKAYSCLAVFASPSSHFSDVVVLCCWPTLARWPVRDGRGRLYRVKEIAQVPTVPIPNHRPASTGIRTPVVGSPAL